MVFITGVLRWMIGDLVARGLRGIQALPVQVFFAVGRRIYRMLEDDEAPLLAAESQSQTSSGLAESRSFSLGSTPTSSSSTSPTPSAGSRICVPEDVAVDMARLIGQVDLAPQSSHGLAFEIEPYHNVEAEIGMEAVVDRQCNV